LQEGTKGQPVGPEDFVRKSTKLKGMHGGGVPQKPTGDERNVGGKPPLKKEWKAKDRHRVQTRGNITRAPKKKKKKKKKKSRKLKGQGC